MVYALGEMLLDVVTDENIPQKEYLAHGHPGGAMLNAAVSLARSGAKTTMVSEIGDDDIGKFLLRFLKESNINTNRYILRPRDACVRASESICVLLIFLQLETHS